MYHNLLLCVFTTADLAVEWLTFKNASLLLFFFASGSGFFIGDKSQWSPHFPKMRLSRFFLVRAKEVLLKGELSTSLMFLSSQMVTGRLSF